MKIWQLQDYLDFLLKSQKDIFYFFSYIFEEGFLKSPTPSHTQSL